MEWLLGFGFVLLLVVGIWVWAGAQQPGDPDAYLDDRRAGWE